MSEEWARSNLDQEHMHGVVEVKSVRHYHEFETRLKE